MSTMLIGRSPRFDMAKVKKQLAPRKRPQATTTLVPTS